MKLDDKTVKQARTIAMREGLRSPKLVMLAKNTRIPWGTLVKAIRGMTHKHLDWESTPFGGKLPPWRLNAGPRSDTD